MTDHAEPGVDAGGIEADAPPPMTERRLIAMVLIVASGAFMQMLDGSILVTAIPQMARSFGVESLALGIGITAYVMATAIVLPASGWLADRIGAKPLFIYALLAFTGTSVLCGLSRSLPAFTAARIFQGLSGAVMGPTGAVILMRTIPRHDLIHMMNIFSAPMLVAPVIGPPLGGFLTTAFGWEWVFFLNIPVGIAGALLSVCYIPAFPRRIRAFDLPGFILSGLGLTGLIVGFGAMADGSIALRFAALLFLAGAIFTALAIRHGRRTPHPILSFTPARYPTFRLTTLIAMPIMRAPMTALPFALPIMLQTGLGLTAFASGAVFLGHTVADLLTKLATTRIFRRHGYRTSMVVATLGLSLCVIGCALAVMADRLVSAIALLALGGLFRSILGSATGTLSYADIPAGDMSSATTLNQIVLQLGQAIAVSMTVLLVTIFAHIRQVSDPFADYCHALIAVGLFGVAALWPILRLPPRAGAALSGHGGGRRPEL